MWAILIVTLPARPNAVRLRTWRMLKGLGCVALRDGAYILPVEHASAFDAVVRDVRAHDGSASVLSLSALDDAQRDALLTQFDRGLAYAEWRETVAALHADLSRLTEADARRRLRGIADALAVLQRIDYYPGAAATQAATDLADLRMRVDAVWSHEEPRAQADAQIELLNPRRYRRRRWATRARPWVDRLASAWLIRRFIDPDASFLWLADPAKAPRGALGFDFDGAQFTHVGTRVTFEVLAASFDLDRDPNVARLSALVHYLDAGGIPVPQAAGLSTLLAGLHELHDDDDRLFEASVPLFDALYAAP